MKCSFSELKITERNQHFTTKL